MIKMTMRQKDSDRLALHLGNFALDRIRRISRIHDQQFTIFFIFEEVTVCVYTSDDAFL